MVWGALVVFTFWFPNDGLGEGERVGGAVPVPDTPEIWGLLLALSVTANVALRDPVAVGVNVTLIVQFALAAKVDALMVELLDCPKSSEVVPVKPLLLTLIAVPLMLE